MEDIRRADRAIFVRELLNPARLVLTLVPAVGVFAVQAQHGFMGWLTGGLGAGLVLFVSGAHALGTSTDKRWLSPRFRALWKAVEDRMARFEAAVAKLRKEQIADLDAMPDGIRATSNALYAALRRADMVAAEVEQSERSTRPPAWETPSRDAQSQELYRLADRNIAEYRQTFAAVMSGVHRTEAQAAVFMTTLDSLRMKMLGYRMVGRSPELGSSDFLAALAEARAQLQSIDTALEELDLGHYPKTIATVPPPIPEGLLREEGRESV